MEVAFLGLSKQHSTNVLKSVDEIWTLNDWYRVYPDIKNPAKIYQIHGNFDLTSLPGRYIDWERHYRESEAEIVTINESDFENGRVFDKQRALDEFGIRFFTSTMSYMFADVIMGGKVKKVFMEGIHLIAGEFVNQVPGVLHAIDLCREMGIEVYSRFEDEWRHKINEVDWASIREPRPYWFDIFTLGEIKYGV